jgi:hypothetical protein
MEQVPSKLHLLLLCRLQVGGKKDPSSNSNFITMDFGKFNFSNPQLPHLQNGFDKIIYALEI